MTDLEHAIERSVDRLNRLNRSNPFLSTVMPHTTEATVGKKDNT